ncbi:MAG: hypothetical protein ACRD35_05565 [Candidatus Acidiferrales bacterium]
MADEVWIATALLHRENPQRDDFTVAEIVERARKEAIAGDLRPGVYVHALQHCVANRAPNPGRYRMLFATGKLTRRLFHRADLSHPAREGAKIVPLREDIPPSYRPLLDWYFSEFELLRAGEEKEDPILSLRGCGKEIWKDEDPNSYVRRLREGWE